MGGIGWGTGESLHHASVTADLNTLFQYLKHSKSKRYTYGGLNNKLPLNHRMKYNLTFKDSGQFTKNFMTLVGRIENIKKKLGTFTRSRILIEKD